MSETNYTIENVTVYKKVKKIPVYSDPSHAWAKVSIKELDKYGLTDKVSCFSYYRNGYAFLEEDCDLELYHKALLANGIKPVYKECWTNKRSRIRNYARMNLNFKQSIIEVKE